MSDLPKCPKCSSEYTYEDGSNYVCPECAHEWPKNAPAENVEQRRVYKDAFGNVLADGDSVTVIKDSCRDWDSVLGKEMLFLTTALIRLPNKPAARIDCNHTPPELPFLLHEKFHATHLLVSDAFLAREKLTLTYYYS